MFVIRHMSAPPVTMEPDRPVSAVYELLQAHQFRHVPIVDDEGRLVGIVTDRDLRSAHPSSVLGDAERQAALSQMAETPVSQIMTPNPVSISAGATLDDALFLLDRHRIGALPVVDDTGAVIGMFSIRDLMRAYNRLFGLGEAGSALIAVEDDGQPQILTRIVRALEDGSVPFTRLVREAADESGAGAGVVYLRVQTLNTPAVHKILKTAGLRVHLPSV
jgi:acetoin utilization protein AcuB